MQGISRLVGERLCKLDELAASKGVKVSYCSQRGDNGRWHNYWLVCSGYGDSYEERQTNRFVVVYNYLKGL